MLETVNVMCLKIEKNKMHNKDLVVLVVGKPRHQIYHNIRPTDLNKPPPVKITLLVVKPSFDSFKFRESFHLTHVDDARWCAVHSRYSSSHDELYSHTIHSSIAFFKKIQIYPGGV